MKRQVITSDTGAVLLTEKHVFGPIYVFYRLNKRPVNPKYNCSDNREEWGLRISTFSFCMKRTEREYPDGSTKMLEDAL